MRRCRACRQRDAEAVRRALARKRGVVVSLVAAAFLVLLVALWSAERTGDAGVGFAGVGLAVLTLWFANEVEAS